jgi:hypothetical protein
MMPLVPVLSDQTGPWQFGHATKSWAFQLWTWTYLLAMILGFFNLLLAMLLNALASAQSETRSATGVVSELCEIFTGLAHRVKCAMKPSSKNLYMSDTKLRELLLARQHSTLLEQDLRLVVNQTIPCCHIPFHTANFPVQVVQFSNMISPYIFYFQ